MPYDLRPGPAPQIAPESFARRRKAVAKTLGRDQVLVVATHTEAVFANDVHHRFRPQSDFWYLTGLGEPGNVLLLEGGTGRSVLWTPERDPRHEIWNGRRLGVERAREAVGVDKALPIDQLARTIGVEARGKDVLAIVDHDPSVRLRVRRALKRELGDGRPVVATHRVRKDPEELKLLRRACRIGVEAMVAAAQAIRPGASEHHVESVLLAAYRNAGSDGPGYPPIVGAGPNAAILHYIANQARIGKGQLVLIDAGCSWGHYTSDITRTFPADGRFPTKHAELYDVVARARDKAVQAVRPGAPFSAPHAAACRALTGGLVELGHLQGDVDSLVQEGAYRDWYMHGTSHFLGLDVHDAGRYRDADGKPIPLAEGMCLTVEPGLYFNADYARCPPGTAGTGIRIEDDVAVTGSGRSVLTRALPTERGAVAALMDR